MTVDAPKAEQSARQRIEQIEAAVLADCARQNLLPPGSRVIVACSGGADSMALLRLLLRCRRALQIEVLAAHVDHGIRGAAAHADAAFVADFCQQNGVPFFLYDALREGVTVPPDASEGWARTLRYRYFDRLAAEQNALVATAHTATDQLETVLLRLARGTGLHGMAGIPPRRGPYRRPFLCLTRADTEAYCAALGQNYVQDATNESDAYARNRLRHTAVPALQGVNPAAEQAAARLCAQLRAVDSWLQTEVAALLQSADDGQGGYRLETLRAAPAPVLDAALHSLVSPVRDAEQKYIDLLRALVLRGTGTVQLTDAVRWQAAGNVLVRRTNTPPKPAPAAPQPFRIGAFCLPGGYFVEFRRVKYEEFLKNQLFFKKDLNCCADCAKIQENMILRTRLPGDFYRPADRGLRKTLKKLYNEQGIPPAERPLLPLLANGSEVVWLWGSGFAEGYAPDAAAQTVLVVHTERPEPPGGV